MCQALMQRVGDSNLFFKSVQKCPYIPKIKGLSLLG